MPGMITGKKTQQYSVEAVEKFPAYLRLALTHEI